MNKFSIYAWPAYSTRKRNPYTYLIYKHVEESGYPVFDFYLSKGLTCAFKIVSSSKCKVFHVHWPSSNTLKSKSAATAWRRALIFFIAFRLIKLFGKKVVWTVHELEDHDNQHPRLKRLIHKLLFNRVDGFISMNRKVMEAIGEKINSAKRQKIAYIPHPHYIGYYSNNITQREAREKLEIATGSFVFLFLGQIREYKNVPALIQAFKELNRKDAVLVIAGWVKSDTLIATIKELIADAKNIKLYDTFVKDEDIQVFLNAADLVVTPYKRIFNSGSVFLNLSFSKPTLAPDMYALSDLKSALGSHWIKTYQGELDAAVLENAMQDVTQEKNLDSHPDLEAYAPEVIAGATVDFYKSLIENTNSLKNEAALGSRPSKKYIL